ncbi:MAG: OmpA family protein [Bacteroidia bacterium]
MMKTGVLTIWASLMLMVLNGYAQVLNNTTIYFDLAQSELTEKAILKLEPLNKRLLQADGNYKIIIKGHADSLGRASVNQSLSSQRAANVAKWFELNGISKRRIITENASFLEPIANNKTEAGRAKNRRVEIRVKVDYNNDIDIAGITLPYEEYVIDSEKENDLITINGTKVFIPNNAFVDEKGNDVLGKITFYYREFNNPMDFVMAGIPMGFENNNEHGHLSSLSMFEIRAKQNGKDLELANGKNIEIASKIKGGSRGMKPYYFDDLLRKWLKLNEIDANDPLFKDRRWTYINFCNQLVEAHKVQNDWILFWALYRTLGTGLFDRMSQEASPQFYTPQQINNREYIDSALVCMKMANALQDSIDKVEAFLAEQNRVYKLATEKRFLAKDNYKLMLFSNAGISKESLFKIRLEPLNKQYTIPDSVLDKTWQMAKLTSNSNKNTYSLSLKNKSTHIRIDSLELKTKDKKRKPQKHFNQYNWDKNYKRNTQVFFAQWRSLWQFTTQKKAVDSLKNEQLMSIEFLEPDSEFLSTMDWQYFGQEAQDYFQEIDFRSNSTNDVVSYFDTKKDSMLNALLARLSSIGRYPSLQTPSVSPNLEYTSNYNPNTVETANTPEFFQPKVAYIPAQNLGFYNWDVYIEPATDLLVKTQYQNHNGIEIKPKVLFVFTEGENGVVRYRYNQQFTPDRFPLNLNTQNQLMVQDHKNQMWLANAKVIDQLKSRISKGESQAVLSLNKIEALRSRSDLYKLVEFR